MATNSDNCSICAEEFEDDKLQLIALSAINVTKFKICNNCLKQADAEGDYEDVRNMVKGYLKSE
jgi:hypothetical protein